MNLIQKLFKIKKTAKKILTSKVTKKIAKITYCTYETYRIYSNPFLLLQYFNVFNALLLIKN